MGELVDMDFIPGSTVAYALSRGADAVQRITWNASGVDLGAPQNEQIDVLGQRDDRPLPGPDRHRGRRATRRART